jgi:hypothetical protein
MGFIKIKHRVALYILCVLFSQWISAQIPSGYYNPAIGKKNAELKTALHKHNSNSHISCL